MFAEKLDECAREFKERTHIMVAGGDDTIGSVVSIQLGSVRSKNSSIQIVTRNIRILQETSQVLIRLHCRYVASVSLIDVVFNISICL